MEAEPARLDNYCGDDILMIITGNNFPDNNSPDAQLITLPHCT